MPGIASTADLSEIRMAFSPDGKRRLWGTVDRSDPPHLRIVESVREEGGWSTAHPVPFASAGDDFDPSFALDGKSVLFFSNRPGGFGGDDIWEVPYDSRAGTYGRPVNLGPVINSEKDEFAPSLSADGRQLLFASNGHGGAGGHDLFIARRLAGKAWGKPRNLRGINGPQDDFDATFVGRGTIVYTSGSLENGPIFLYRARLKRGRYEGRERLPAPFNCSKTFNLGPSWSALTPGVLYFSAACPSLGPGRADIFSAPIGK